ncbi:MAG: glycosyltransferase family 2 protein [Anaerolineae bacterium]
MMASLTAGILARNNEDEIAACLESVSWADERLVILDTRSTDRTAEIAQALGAKVVSHRFEDFGRQREFGLQQVYTDWLFYIDTDERASAELGAELCQVMEDETRAGWWVPRRNLIWGREIRHGGWYPDYQLRLLRVGCAHYDLTREVHEIVALEGAEGYLREPLVHHNYQTVRQFVAKQRQYVAYEAAIRYKQGVRPHPWTYLSMPLREFHRRYFKLSGYRDGLHGLLLCLLTAYYYGFRATCSLGAMVRQAQPA